MEGEVALTIYGRRDCHLCTEMLQAISEIDWGVPIEVRYVDIDGEPALADKYNDTVPVLMHGDSELCRVRLNVETVLAHLKQIR